MAIPYITILKCLNLIASSWQWWKGISIYLYEFNISPLVINLLSQPDIIIITIITSAIAWRCPYSQWDWSCLYISIYFRDEMVLQLWNIIQMKNNCGKWLKHSHETMKRSKAITVWLKSYLRTTTWKCWIEIRWKTYIIE